VDLGGKVLQAPKNQGQFRVQGGCIRALSPLRVQGRQALTEAADPRRTFVLVNEAIRVTVDPPRQARPQLAELGLDGGKGGALGMGVWRYPAPVCLGQPLWVGQPRPDCLPDRQIEPSRPHRRMVTDALPPEAVRVCPHAPLRGRRAGLPLPGPGAEAFPVVGLATMRALDHPWQQRQGAAG
jgi:hypothetical protein